MIARLRGVLWKRAPEAVVVDAGGVGYRLLIPLSTFFDLPGEGSTVDLHVHTHVREDALLLFGFLTPFEKELFEKLISVSKVGPRIALNILSGIPAARLADALRRQDLAALSAVPGVGMKTAERLVLELRGKIGPVGHDDQGPAAVPAAADEDRLAEDVTAALINLGYRRKDAEKAFKLSWDAGERSLEALIRKSLARLSS